ncbi:unnamed protein product [Dicrocoelium dendriticum]|nr:unnamed protein product [Dicrocoelium dendriticum]
MQYNSMIFPLNNPLMLWPSQRIINDTLSVASTRVDRGLNATAQAFPSSYSSSRALSSQLHFYPQISGPPPSWFDMRLSSSFNSHTNAERHPCPVDKSMSIQTENISSSVSIWGPRSSLRLACLNVRTLLHLGQQAALVRTLETLSIDIRCLLDTCLKDPSSVLTLRSPHATLAAHSHYACLEMVQLQMTVKSAWVLV